MATDKIKLLKEKVEFNGILDYGGLYSFMFNWFKYEDFIPIEKETIYDRLKNNNFNKYGNEILYNGYTGQQISTEIFLGPTFYFRLKHMVAEKINSRGVGKVVGLTRQPTEGRRKGGGLRIGEMERDTVLSHGISNFIKESMMERSDSFAGVYVKDAEH